ncbi:MAG: hypothetical protein JEZ07_08955 [Phycisphaerae bacterium]|nr:hypothetical protein [Phycisphaerae bacterium]
MRIFSDTTGRQWQINMTIGSVKQVKALTGYDLLELDKGDRPLLATLRTDIMAVCDVIFALVKKQAEEAGISDEQFAEALGGNAIVVAQDAFWDELEDFCQSLNRQHLAKAIQAMGKTVNLAYQKISQQVDQLDIEQMLNDQFTKISGELPESSELTPAD